MTQLPHTAKRLNAWLYNTFSVCEGPPRAYFELPVEFEMAGQKSVFSIRRTYITTGLTGSEELCCKQLAEALLAIVSLEELQDHIALLFIRTAFEWTAETQGVYGRLVFWNAVYNTKLQASRIFKPQGALANPALRVDEI